ncbi:MAG TPA: hypothetical protein VFU36_13130 [Jatrophihabitans sp.]|nr:hypothetical protein [Jatrophihabitans sp.]
MDPLACRLLHLLPRTRSGRVPAASSGRWACLELTGLPSGPVLRSARELVVHRPSALTLQVLAAAPNLLAVVLPEHCRLPVPVTTELARRQIATVWRRLPGPMPDLAGPALVGSVLQPARPPASCAMTWRGSMP